MKIITLVIGLILMASGAFGAPFLISDPQAGVTSYKLTGPSWVPVSVSAQPDGSIRMDVSTSVAGSNALTVAACKNDPIWGEVCSVTVPFSFTRPGPASGPQNIRLVP